MKVRERREPGRHAPEDEVREIFAPLRIDRMSGPEFEAFVAELMSLTGFDVERVGGSGDLGADLVADTGTTRYTVQVKRFDPETPVSRRAVSDAVAARSHYGCDAAMVVTTATFSDDVREFAADRCVLIGREVLADWVSTHRDELVSRVDADTLDRFSGEDFEGFVAELLRDRGHRVEVVGGTGDYGADLLVEGGGERAVVQVKRHREPVSRRAVSDAVAAVDHYGFDAAMVVTSAPGFTDGARTLAESTDCELVDRSGLEAWVSDFSGASEVADEGPYADPDELVGHLEWREAVLDASAGQFEIDVAGSQFGLFLSALFLRRVPAEATARYSGMPEDTWLVMGLPEHPKVSWSVQDPRAGRSGPVFWVPVEGTGTFRLDVKISFSGGLEEGLEEAQRTVEAWGTNYPAQFTQGEPDGEAVETVREMLAERG